ncbi:DUF6538 domain-containing protein [uncultured Cohaesibacter sp.]|uniref:DUF6538 domain-containing protein n=1 Tax=uncultured Cohaesibacter sp. TaxID=1002546 RepID=UPI002AAB88EC|nr:DUF6538 domain-containing protein [uncultured Cohaesibacter sp.]
MEPAIGINATAISSSREQKYSTKIRGVFYYTRTIPQDVRDLDPRPNPVQKSLNTKNLDIAMSRRDMLQQCDDRFWRWLRGSKVPFQQPSELAAAGEDIKDLFGTDDLPFTPPPPSFPKGEARLLMQARYQKQLKQIFAESRSRKSDHKARWIA